MWLQVNTTSSPVRTDGCLYYIRCVYFSYLQHICQSLLFFVCILLFEHLFWVFSLLLFWFLCFLLSSSYLSVLWPRPHSPVPQDVSSLLLPSWPLYSVSCAHCFVCFPAPCVCTSSSVKTFVFLTGAKPFSILDTYQKGTYSGLISIRL